jgi:hypothetical protein
LGEGARGGLGCMSGRVALTQNSGKCEDGLPRDRLATLIAERSSGED